MDRAEVLIKRRSWLCRTPADSCRQLRSPWSSAMEIIHRLWTTMRRLTRFNSITKILISLIIVAWSRQRNQLSPLRCISRMLHIKSRNRTRCLWYHTTATNTAKRNSVKPAKPTIRLMKMQVWTGLLWNEMLSCKVTENLYKLQASIRVQTRTIATIKPSFWRTICNQVYIDQAMALHHSWLLNTWRTRKSNRCITSLVFRCQATWFQASITGRLPRNRCSTRLNCIRCRVRGRQDWVWPSRCLLKTSSILHTTLSCSHLNSRHSWTTLWTKSRCEGKKRPNQLNISDL